MRCRQQHRQIQIIVSESPKRPAREASNEIGRYGM
jgi:hypothetical protein